MDRAAQTKINTNYYLTATHTGDLTPRAAAKIARQSQTTHYPEISRDELLSIHYDQNRRKLPHHSLLHNDHK
jgi:hypothetical protein